jgi:hypothetical protein
LHPSRLPLLFLLLVIPPDYYFFMLFYATLSIETTYRQKCTYCNSCLLFFLHFYARLCLLFFFCYSLYLLVNMVDKTPKIKKEVFEQWNIYSTDRFQSRACKLGSH